MPLGKTAKTFAKKKATRPSQTSPNHYLPAYSKFRNRLQQRPDGMGAPASLVSCS